MTRSSDHPTPDTEQASEAGSTWFSAVLYPNLYLWLIFVSTLDVILTRVVLFFGGTEVNPLADWVLGHFGRMGMSIFKFLIVAFVIIVCEYIGRRSWTTAHRLARVSIVISVIPVCWSCLIILMLIINPPPTEDLPIEGRREAAVEVTSNMGSEFDMPPTTMQRHGTLLKLKHWRRHV